MKPTDEMVEAACRVVWGKNWDAFQFTGAGCKGQRNSRALIRSALTAALASQPEAGAGPFIGAQAFDAVVNGASDEDLDRIIRSGIAPAPSGMGKAVEALETAEAWIDRHTRHIGSCFDFPQCTCGRTAVLYELREALSALKAEEAGS